MGAHRLTELIPQYLAHYIVKQDDSLYTPIDHAVWRFILKISHNYFREHAHKKYLDGLEATGISTDRIPLIEEMDDKLRKFGWRAVAVSGFLPPSVFMEFLSLGILTIACDMRDLDNLAYTPAPDIVHEAAGHAPIIADPEYRDYLRAYGEISRRAIASHQDIEVYYAIRHLSDTKGRSDATEQELRDAQARLDVANSGVTFDSEAALLSRMGWWTFEYGLIGSLDSPKIYGAGLLSSVGESYHCLGPGVRKIPFSIDCIHQSYDITKPQPQLFVAPDFATLRRGLEELADQMAFRKGGMLGLQRALEARTVTTVELANGIQISGVLSEVQSDATGAVSFLRWKGPVQLAEKDQSISEHGPERHPEGFSLPLGEWSLAPVGAPRESLGKKIQITFRSGFKVNGRLTGLQSDDRIWTFEDCSVIQPNGKVVYEPGWGPFDLVRADAKIPSVFGGAADRPAYQQSTGGPAQEPGHPKSNMTEENRALNALYAQVRTARERGQAAPTTVLDTLNRDYPNDWLLRYELLELAQAQGDLQQVQALRKALEKLARIKPEAKELIARGLECS